MVEKITKRRLRIHTAAPTSVKKGYGHPPTILPIDPDERGSRRVAQHDFIRSCLLGGLGRFGSQGKLNVRHRHERSYCFRRVCWPLLSACAGLAQSTRLSQDQDATIVGLQDRLQGTDVRNLQLKRIRECSDDILGETSQIKVAAQPCFGLVEARGYVSSSDRYPRLLKSSCLVSSSEMRLPACP